MERMIELGEMGRYGLKYRIRDDLIEGMRESREMRGGWIERNRKSREEMDMNGKN